MHDAVAFLRNQTDWDDLDGWLKYMKKPLPMRLIAPMTMKRLNMRITFLENYTKVRFQRDFGSGPTSFDAVLTIGDANFVQFVDDATGETNNMKCDLVEEDETMIISMKQKGMPDTRVVRRLLDNNTVEAVWSSP